MPTFFSPIVNDRHHSADSKLYWVHSEPNWFARFPRKTFIRVCAVYFLSRVGILGWNLMNPASGFILPRLTWWSYHATPHLQTHETESTSFGLTLTMFGQSWDFMSKLQSLSTHPSKVHYHGARGAFFHFCILCAEIQIGALEPG